MQYKLIQDSDCICRLNGDGTTSVIPNDLENRDWQAYQAWLAEDPENNVPLPAE